MVVDAREFFYSRIALAIGSDVLIQVLDAEGTWVYCNEAAVDFRLFRSEGPVARGSRRRAIGGSMMPAFVICLTAVP